MPTVRLKECTGGALNALLSYGFYIVLGLILAGYSVARPSFFALTSLMDVLHAASPLMILASGLSLVIISRQIDISVGSIAFLSAGAGVLLMMRLDLPPASTFLVIAAVGAALGALNGLVVVVLRLNPLITTLSTMLALRGIALQLTNARVIGLPEGMQTLGNATLGPVYVDTIIALAILIIVHGLHTRTPFGRHITAIGNGPEAAQRVGVRVRQITFLAFMLSGLLASVGGFFSMAQVGALTSRLGLGLEFTAIAVIIIGGISLFGGEGRIIPGLIMGAAALVVIENGLVYIGASPFAYPLVRGGLIFIAMYADSLKSLLQAPVRRRAGESASSGKGARQVAP